MLPLVVFAIVRFHAALRVIHIQLYTSYLVKTE